MNNPDYDNLLNKVKGSERLVKGSEKPNNFDKDINVHSKDELQTNGYQTFNGTSVYVSRLEGEPQTDCARMKGADDE